MLHKIKNTGDKQQVALVAATRLTLDWIRSTLYLSLFVGFCSENFARYTWTYTQITADDYSVKRSSP